MPRWLKGTYTREFHKSNSVTMYGVPHVDPGWRSSLYHHWIQRLMNPAVSDHMYISLPPIINSLKKQKTLYKVLTPSIKPPIYILMGLRVSLGTIGCIGI